MDDDIVARLRVLTSTLSLGDFHGLAETTHSAADEIERLRDLLARYTVIVEKEEEREGLWLLHGTISKVEDE